MIAEPGLNLTVVVPISEMAGRLQFLASWLPSALSHGINVTIVHDIAMTLLDENYNHFYKFTKIRF